MHGFSLLSFKTINIFVLNTLIVFNFVIVVLWSVKTHSANKSKIAFTYGNLEIKKIIYRDKDENCEKCFW